MSYEYRVKPPAKDGSFAATFPALQAELDANVVQGSKIGRALDRLGRQLLRQFKDHELRESRSTIIGVQFHSLNFSFILDPKKPERKDW